MAEATAEQDGLRTGMVAVVQSAGDLLKPNPHVHAIVPRGGWDAHGWLGAATLCGQPCRCDGQTPEVVRYRRKRPSPLGKLTETLAPLEFLARALIHVAELRLHAARYYGHYSSVARGRPARADHAEQLLQSGVLAPSPPLDARASSTETRRLRRQWAQLLRRIFEIDPLTCAHCGAQMKVISFIADPPVVEKILRHLGARSETGSGARASRWWAALLLTAGSPPDSRPSPSRSSAAGAEFPSPRAPLPSVFPGTKRSRPASCKSLAEKDISVVEMPVFSSSGAASRRQEKQETRENSDGRRWL